MKNALRLTAAAAIFLSLLACKKLEGLRGGPEEPLPAVEAGEAGGANVEGKYAGAGTNPEGGTYSCDVAVTGRGSVYSVMWYFDGQPGYEGTGIVKGNTFVVGYAGPQGYGVVAYTVKADGTLDGTWTAAGATRVGTEKLEKK